MFLEHFQGSEVLHVACAVRSGVRGEYGTARVGVGRVISSVCVVCSELEKSLTDVLRPVAREELPRDLQPGSCAGTSG